MEDIDAVQGQLPEIKNLQELLQNHLEEYEKIQTYKSQAATSIGDNYGSTALAVEIIIQDPKKVTSHSLHTFCKMLPKDEETRQIFNVDISFVKEMKMYSMAIPAMLQLQQENNVPEEHYVTKLTPKYYGGRIGLQDKVDDDALIVLEDLRQRSFQLADRKVGVDYQHAKLTIEKLAVFHALPVALKISKPHIFQKAIMEAATHFEFGGELSGGVADRKFTEIMVANMKKWPELSSFVEAVEKVCLEIISNRFPEAREPFATVVHNDLWVNNMLFHYEHNKPDEVVFLDFQITQYSSPFRDVLFFLFTSVQAEVRQAHLDELIELYHKRFCKCLEEVNVDTTKFTLKAVWDEIKLIAPKELYHILSMLRFIVADKDFIIENPKEFAMHEDLGGQHFKDKLKDVVLEYAERNWL